MTGNGHPSITRGARSLGAGVWMVVICALAFGVFTLFELDLMPRVAAPELRDHSWRWAFKQAGDLRFWVVVALICFAWKRDWRWPAGLLGAGALAGGLAELLKLVFGRERPVRDFILQVDNGYVWKDGPLGPLFGGFWDSSNLGLPSSHTAVAFGGAWMLGMLDPKLRWGAVAIAIVCGVTRVLAGAHFPTDVALGAMTGVGAAHLVALLGRKDTPPAPDTMPTPT